MGPVIYPFGTETGSYQGQHRGFWGVDGLLGIRKSVIKSAVDLLRLYKVQLAASYCLPWVVAKPRIELGTQGFSVLCSTD